MRSVSRSIASESSPFMCGMKNASDATVPRWSRSDSAK